MYKRFLILAGAFILFNAYGSHVKAQEVTNGIRGGLTLSNLYVDTDELDDENARLGFHVGFFSQILYSDVLGIQPELVFTTKGSEASYTGVIDQTVDFSMSYIDLPVLLVFKPLEALEIHAGPYGGLLLSSNIEFTGTIEGEEEIDRDHFNTIDYGFSFGLTLDTGPVAAGIRYNLGLQKLADSDVTNLLLGDSKHSYGQLFLALRL